MAEFYDAHFLHSNSAYLGFVELASLDGNVLLCQSLELYFKSHGTAR